MAIFGREIHGHMPRTAHFEPFSGPQVHLPALEVTLVPDLMVPETSSLYPISSSASPGFPKVPKAASIITISMLYIIYNIYIYIYTVYTI